MEHITTSYALLASGRDFLRLFSNDGLPKFGLINSFANFQGEPLSSSRLYRVVTVVVRLF